jgi:hypothetical protein
MKTLNDALIGAVSEMRWPEVGGVTEASGPALRLLFRLADALRV